LFVEKGHHRGEVDKNLESHVVAAFRAWLMTCWRHIPHIDSTRAWLLDSQLAKLLESWQLRAWNKRPPVLILRVSK